jgi:hypothetical protein
MINQINLYSGLFCARPSYRSLERWKLLKMSKKNNFFSNTSKLGLQTCPTRSFDNSRIGQGW